MLFAFSHNGPLSSIVPLYFLRVLIVSPVLTRPSAPGLPEKKKIEPLLIPGLKKNKAVEEKYLNRLQSNI